MASARAVMRLHGVIAAAGLVVIVAAVAVLARLVTFAPPPAATLADACRGFVLPALTPSILLVVVTTVLVASTLLRAAASAGRQVIVAGRLERALRDSVRPLDGHAGVWTYFDRRPAAFCAGLLRPRVVVSSRVVRDLDEDALRAVIAHEAHHALRHDPLRLLVSRTLADGLFFLPVLRRLSDRYADLVEIDADRAAVLRNGCGPGPLATALLSLAPAQATTGIAPERVDGLLGYPVRADVPISALTAGLVSLAVVLGAVATTADVTWHAGLTLNVPTLAAQGCMVATGTATVVALAAGATLICRLARSLYRRRPL